MINNKRNNSIDKIKELSLIEEEKIDLILKDITLICPGNPYSQFVKEQIDKEKEKNKDIKIDIIKLNDSLVEKWKNLKDSEKEKFTKLFKEKRAKYQSDIELVRHYLFKDYNDSIHSPPTAYKIFVNEKLRDGFEHNLDPKEIKKEAALQWKKMSLEEKKIYYNKKKENDNWFLKAEKIKKINPIALFIQKTIEEFKKMNQNPPTIKELSVMWKNMSNEDKNTYRKYAQELNDEKEKLQDIYEIIHGIKPKRPAGAFRIFLQEKAKNNELKDIYDGHEKWRILSEDEKEEYLIKSHRCRLAYRYKKMIYNKKINKILPKKPLTALNIFYKEKQGQIPPNGVRFFTYWKNIFDHLSKEEKTKYENKAEKSREIYDKKIIEFSDKVFDIPKKPNNAFLSFLSERIPDLRKEMPEISNNVLIRQVAKEWQEGKLVDKEMYQQQFEKEKKIFLRQLKQFEKFGYYTKDTENNEANDKTNKKVKKKRSSSNYSSKNNKKHRDNTVRIYKENGMSQKPIYWNNLFGNF